MELIELESIWKEYDKKITNNTRLNKEILRRMLTTKSEKRISWIKIKAAYKLILPIVIVMFMFVPHLEIRTTIDFYIGLVLFSVFSIITYYWAIRYYLLICRIDFSAPILTIKKEIAELGKYKIKVNRISFILAPFAMIGIFMLAQIPIFNKNSVLIFTLIFSIFIITFFYTKHSIFDQFRKLDKEIIEIEELEKE